MTLAPESLVGQAVGPYTVTALLGGGGMAWVLAANDADGCPGVALKLLKPKYAGDVQFTARFLNEATVAGELRHPNIIRILDVGQHGEAVYFAMPQLLGSLAERLGDDAALPEQDVMRIARDVARAMAFAHEAGVIHRDIKPQNLFLTPEAGGFQTRILDFGLAKSLSSSSPLTQTGTIIGTPLYMAPEQVLGRNVDERTDTFAFASVVYEALLGISPVRATVLSEIMSDILHAPVLPPSQFVSWLTPEIDAGFAHALSKDPAERPENPVGWAENLACRLESLGSPRDGWPDLAQASDSRSSLSTGDLATTQSAVHPG